MFFRNNKLFLKCVIKENRYLDEVVARKLMCELYNDAKLKIEKIYWHILNRHQFYIILQNKNTLNRLKRCIAKDFNITIIDEKDLPLTIERLKPFYPMDI